MQQKIEVVFVAHKPGAFSKFTPDDIDQLEKELNIKIIFKELLDVSYTQEKKRQERIFVLSATPLKPPRISKRHERRQRTGKQLQEKYEYDGIEMVTPAPPAPVFSHVKNQGLADEHIYSIGSDEINADKIRAIVQEIRRQIEITKAIPEENFSDEDENSDDLNGRICRELSFSGSLAEDGEDEKTENSAEVASLPITATTQGTGSRFWRVPVLAGMTVAGAMATGFCIYKSWAVIQPIIQPVMLGLSLLGLSPTLLALLTGLGIAGIVLMTLGIAFSIQHACTRNTPAPIPMPSNI